MKRRSNLNVQNIGDLATREALLVVKQELETQPFLNGDWKFFEIEFGRAATAYEFRHGLGFQPKDIIQTSLIGSGTITWNYADFDSTNLNITTSGACTVRFFVGRYEKAG